MGFLNELQKTQEGLQKIKWEGTFTDYLLKVRENKNIARLAHSRIYHMIASRGITKTWGLQQYNFFASDLFGLDKTLEKIVEDYLHPAARRLDTRKRILVLVGPVGGGKSTIVNMLKKGLEKYSRTEEGALYGIKGCPMHEEPLHLIPEEMRELFYHKYGIYIEGNLCPTCKTNLKDKYNGNIEDVKVERVIISEEERRGIGTLSPSDPKSQDISELTGSIDFSTICQYGSESDPRAYRFDGELNKANRGIMEFQEIFKFDEKFLYNLLNLSQEGNFKVGRYALISADEMIIAHSNETEYRSFINCQKNEALRSRMMFIQVPYNLEVGNELKIYEKIIKTSDISVHIEPHALWTTAAFLILTRLMPSKNQGLTLINKMKLYNGEQVEGFYKKDADDFRREFSREGMEGLDPRFIINVICSVLGKRHNKCAGSQDFLKALKVALRENDMLINEVREKYLGFLEQVRQEYFSKVKKDLFAASRFSFAAEARVVFKEYLEMICAFVKGKAYDESFMRALEEHMNVSENAKKGFREEIYVRYSGNTTVDLEHELDEHKLLKNAIFEKLFFDLRELLRLKLASYSKDDKKLQEIIQFLIVEYGYCEECALKLLQTINSLTYR